MYEFQHHLGAARASPRHWNIAYMRIVLLYREPLPRTQEHVLASGVEFWFCITLLHHCTLAPGPILAPIGALLPACHTCRRSCHEL